MLRAVPETDMAAEDLCDTVDRLRDAAETFGPPTAVKQQYAALIPDLELLLARVERYADRPMRLHETALQLLRRLETRVAQDECPRPEQDALIADYRSELLIATQDIERQDDRVREAVQERVKAAIGALTEEEVDALNAPVAQAEKITEADLKTELVEDLATLKDPHASPEASRQAVYRLVSRLIRITRYTMSETAKLVEDVTIISGGAWVLVRLLTK